jgi:hypothetical protein
MAEHKNFFRTMYDAMVESRTRQAEREVAHYRHAFSAGSTEADKL